jgi:hypothetical protein
VAPCEGPEKRGVEARGGVLVTFLWGRGLVGAAGCGLRAGGERGRERRSRGDQKKHTQPKSKKTRRKKKKKKKKIKGRAVLTTHV